MRQVRAFVVLLFLTVTGCPSSNAVGYVDADALPDGFLGSSHRAWLEGSQILVEVEQIPGLNVVDIHYRVEGEDVYLMPRRASSGGGGTYVVTVDLSSETLAEGWASRVYWLTGEFYYPLGHPGFWDRSERRPSERVKLRL